MKVVLRKMHLKIQKNPPAHHNSSFSRKNISGNIRDIKKIFLKLFLLPILFHGKISFDNLTYFKLYGNLNCITVSLVSRKYIEISVVDDEEYEKHETFFVVLGEPKVVRREEDRDEKPELYDPEKERLEELGKPKLSKLLVSFVRNWSESGSCRTANLTHSMFVFQIKTC